MSKCGRLWTPRGYRRETGNHKNRADAPGSQPDSNDVILQALQRSAELPSVEKRLGSCHVYAQHGENVFFPGSAVARLPQIVLCPVAFAGPAYDCRFLRYCRPTSLFRLERERARDLCESVRR